MDTETNRAVHIRTSDTSEGTVVYHVNSNKSTLNILDPVLDSNPYNIMEPVSAPNSGSYNETGSVSDLIETHLNRNGSSLNHSHALDDNGLSNHTYINIQLPSNSHITNSNDNSSHANSTSVNSYNTNSHINIKEYFVESTDNFVNDNIVDSSSIVGGVHHGYVPTFMDRSLLDSNMTFSEITDAHLNHTITDITGYAYNGSYSDNYNFLWNDSMYADVDFDMNYDDFIAEIESRFYSHHLVEVAVLIALYILSFLVGFMGNVLVVCVFTKNRKMRTVTNSFLVNLAICDLLVVCMCMPFSIAMEIYKNWVYGDVWCKLVNFSQGLSLSSSIITLTVISAERFYAVRHPLRARAFMSRSRVIKIILCIWLISALTVLPILFVRKEVVVDQVLTVSFRLCMEQWHSTHYKHMYNFTVLTILYIGPVSFICIGYLRIGINLWRTDSALHAGPSNSGHCNRTQIGRRKVAKMLFIMAILFAASWFPFQILSVSIDFFPEQLTADHGVLIRNVFAYAAWLGHTNSSINPICYCIMSQSFKRAIKLELMRCCQGKYADTVAMTSYYQPSMSMTMSTSNANTRSRITPVSKNGYKLVSSGANARNRVNSGVLLPKTTTMYSRKSMHLSPISVPPAQQNGYLSSPNSRCSSPNGLSPTLREEEMKITPDLLKHISTNI